MDDAALADAMRQMLIDTGRHGASDLHLSAGSRPFIRKHRALLPITEHILKEVTGLTEAGYIQAGASSGVLDPK